MQLTMYMDYSLRVLLHLAKNKNRLVTIAEIAKTHDISHYHLVKVVQNLVAREFVQTVRGKSGGMRLIVEAADIRIGDVVSQTEPHMNLLECFDQEKNTCPLISDCRLKGVFYLARKSFVDTLDRYTLEDMLK